METEVALKSKIPSGTWVTIPPLRVNSMLRLDIQRLLVGMLMMRHQLVMLMGSPHLSLNKNNITNIIRIMVAESNISHNFGGPMEMAVDPRSKTLSGIWATTAHLPESSTARLDTQLSLV